MRTFSVTRKHIALVFITISESGSSDNFCPASHSGQTIIIQRGLLLRILKGFTSSQQAWSPALFPLALYDLYLKSSL